MTIGSVLTEKGGSKGVKKEDICFVRKSRTIGWHEINKLFGSIYEKRVRAHEFFKKRKTDMIIPIEELEKHKAALFQTVHNNHFQEYSFEDVLIDFKVDREKGEVKAQKLMIALGEYELETRIYYIENYGKTWRAWAALPTRDAAKRWD